MLGRSNPPSSHSLCGPDCRYRSLYEGAQASLSDMAGKQAAALGRHGRLRAGIISALRASLPRQFGQLELRIAARMSDVDDDSLIAYVTYLLESAVAEGRMGGVTSPAGDDLTELAAALAAEGYDVGDSTDPYALAAALRRGRPQAAAAAGDSAPGSGPTAQAPGGGAVGAASSPHQPYSTIRPDPSTGSVAPRRRTLTEVARERGEGQPASGGARSQPTASSSQETTAGPGSGWARPRPQQDPNAPGPGGEGVVSAPPTPATTAPSTTANARVTGGGDGAAAPEGAWAAAAAVWSPPREQAGPDSTEVAEPSVGPGTGPGGQDDDAERDLLDAWSAEPVADGVTSAAEDSIVIDGERLSGDEILDPWDAPGEDSWTPSGGLDDIFADAAGSWGGPSDPFADAEGSDPLAGAEGVGDAEPSAAAPQGQDVTPAASDDSPGPAEPTPGQPLRQPAAGSPASGTPTEDEAATPAVSGADRDSRRVTLRPSQPPPEQPRPCRPGPGRCVARPCDPSSPERFPSPGPAGDGVGGARPALQPPHRTRAST